MPSSPRKLFFCAELVPNLFLYREILKKKKRVVLLLVPQSTFLFYSFPFPFWFVAV